MKMLAHVFAVLLVFAGLYGCAPPPLTEAPPDAGEPGPDGSPSDATSPDGSDSGVDSDADSRDVPAAPPFSDIASLIGKECAKANCHGNPSTNSSDFAIGTNSPSDQDVRNSLEGVSITEPMAPMVEPGKPEESGLYQALTGSEGRTQMPLGNPLDAEKVDTIRSWIAGGAPYE